ncbi:hypothetical protein LCGC14_3073940, partial [marine sediment metagenome]
VRREYPDLSPLQETTDDTANSCYFRWHVQRDALPGLLHALRSVGAMDLCIKEGRIHLLAVVEKCVEDEVIGKMSDALSGKTGHAVLRNELISGQQAMEFKGPADEAANVVRILTGIGVRTVLAIQYFVELEDIADA